MSDRDDGSNSVERLIARLRQSEATPSVLRMADRLARRAAPIARTVCFSEGRGLPEARLEELAQETLEIVWRKIEDFDADVGSFEAWVRGIAKHLCKNERRKHRDLLTTDGVLEASDPAHPVLRAMLREQRETILSGVIESTLEGIEQDIVYHRYIHNLDRERIAELLELQDADEVRKILFTAMRRLRKALLMKLEALGHGPSLMRSEG